MLGSKYGPLGSPPLEYISYPDKDQWQEVSSVYPDVCKVNRVSKVNRHHFDAVCCKFIPSHGHILKRVNIATYNFFKNESHQIMIIHTKRTLSVLSQSPRTLRNSCHKYFPPFACKFGLSLATFVVPGGLGALGCCFHIVAS